MEQYVIGVDMGTTSTKAVLFRLNGEVVETAYAYYPLIKERPELAEQDLGDIYQAVRSTIREVVVQAKAEPEQVLCVSFSSAMHSLILMDKENQPLTRSITWADNRSIAYAEWLKAFGGAELYHRTGTPLHPMSPLCKILWFKEEQPELFAQTDKFIGVKEYVFYQLFGQYKVDYSVASSTGLFNIHKLAWDKLAMAKAGITSEQLSKAVSPTDKVNGLSEEMAAELGLRTDTPFVLGGNDGCLSNLGVGAVDPGAAAVTIGTSGAVRMVTDQPYIDLEGRTFCYVLDEKHWVVGGAVNNGGVVLDWARKRFAEKGEAESYEAVMKRIATVPAGSNGLLFHPYLNGERAPLWDADARGSFFGIHMMHESQHFLRAVLEGICYNVYDVLTEISSLAGKPEKILATGGFSQSAVWRQMLTDVFQQDITLPESYESSCLGAAVLGLKSIGFIESIDAVKEMVGSRRTYQPNARDSEVYRQTFPLYQKLSRQFAEYYQELVELQQSTDRHLL